jgi:hypothetical protein
MNGHLSNHSGYPLERLRQKILLTPAENFFILEDGFCLFSVPAPPFGDAHHQWTVGNFLLLLSDGPILGVPHRSAASGSSLLMDPPL